MAKIKMKRHIPTIDMTPMVDLGFLLVTFFMMTTQFQPSELATITTPRATAQTKLPEANNATVVVSKDNRVFFRMDGTKNLKTLGEKLNSKYNLGMTESDIEKFSHKSGFGLDLRGMKQFLSLTETQQKNTAMSGIPVDDDNNNNQLADWIIYARIANPDVRLVVKGDKETNYPVIKKVTDTLVRCNVNKFYLITDTKENTNS